MQQGQKIREIQVSINEHGEVTKDISTHLVLGVSEDFICLDNSYFTKIAVSKLFSTSYDSLDKVRIHEWQLMSYEPKSLRAAVYTNCMTNKIIETRIKKAYQKYISEKAWFLDVSRYLNKIKL